MSTEIDEILAELKRLRKELDELKSFDVPRPSGDFLKVSGDTGTGNYLITGDIARSITLLTANNTGTIRPEFTVEKVRGTIASPTAVVNGDTIGFFGFKGYDGSIYPLTGLIQGSVDGAVSGSTVPMAIEIITGATAAGRAARIHINSDGRVGIITTAPTAAFSVNEKCAMNGDGGFMVKLTNKTGGNSVKGEVVTTASGTNNAVIKTVQDVPNAIGVFYESGVADGSEAWIVVAGIADVYYIGSTTRGYLARTFVAADAGYVTGQAMSEAVPTSPFATDKHLAEIGHLLESRTGAGTAKTILHFN